LKILEAGTRWPIGLIFQRAAERTGHQCRASEPLGQDSAANDPRCSGTIDTDGGVIVNGNLAALAVDAKAERPKDRSAAVGLEPVPNARGQVHERAGYGSRERAGVLGGDFDRDQPERNHAER